MARAEKLMGATSTFLPISFLAVGMERSRSVARVMLPGLSTGTGFLLDGDLLVTNHHVIPDAPTARAARIQLNVQESGAGRPEEIDEYGLDPESAFVTSPMTGGHDYTVVRVAGAPTARWGALPLSTAGTAVGSRVMIVQHPEGGFKKVALHNNLVTYVDDDVIQYLTDTLPGSSGSPVFDSAWTVVGVHHAGGELVEPGTGRRVFRNEGIAIARVAEAVHGIPAR
jgi:V8-like Glu-specific endopeptidase